MKPTDIKVGSAYRNRGKGRTVRKVLAIGDHLDALWNGDGPAPKGPVVQYSQEGKVRSLYLSSFAAWAGSEVVND